MPGEYEIFVQDHFSASHALRGYDGNWADLHGHNWTVEAQIRCTRLNQLGIGIDYRDVKSVLRDVLGKLNHTRLNDVMEFGNINPTSENLAKFLYKEMGRRLNTDHIRVTRVKVFESPGCGAAYRQT